jgi:uncharacterized membrane protein YdjX (TVP38/TMEM64 family)
MGLIEYYLLFAFSSSITACYLWFWPLLQKAKQENIKNSFTEYPVLSVLIYVLASALVAPLIIYPLISNKAGEAWERGLSKEIFKED